MRGVELSRAYFEAYGLPMLERRFPELLPVIAAGVCGQGSENFGFDDDVSRDHDFDPGFFLWLPQPYYKEYEFRLSRAYDALPDVFAGVALLGKSVYETSRHGVRETDAFFAALTGFPAAPPTNAAWCAVPSFRLACAVNGEIFYDGAGDVSARRAALSQPPRDVLYKKIAAAAALAAQAGQYNYARSLRHGERGAAALALGAFAKQVCELLFLLNGGWCPFYKWALRGARALPVLGNLADALDRMLADPLAPGTEAGIEAVAGALIAELRRRGLSEHPSDFLEPHAYEIAAKIRDPALRAMHIMEA